MMHFTVLSSFPACGCNLILNPYTFATARQELWQRMCGITPLLTTLPPTHTCSENHCENALGLYSPRKVMSHSHRRSWFKLRAHRPIGGPYGSCTVVHPTWTSLESHGPGSRIHPDSSRDVTVQLGPWKLIILSICKMWGKNGNC